MTNKISIFLCAGLLIFSSGCQGANTRATEGAVIGGILGGAAGGIIGHQSRHAGEGAAIGVAAGAITGAIVGSQVPKSSQQEATPAQPASAPQPAQPAQSANPNQISLQQIVDLSQQGVDENVIIDKIRLTNSRYSLDQADISYLQQKGVSQKVVDVMQGK